MNIMHFKVSIQIRNTVWKNQAKIQNIVKNIEYYKNIEYNKNIIRI